MARIRDYWNGLICQAGWSSSGLGLRNILKSVDKSGAQFAAHIIPSGTQNQWNWHFDCLAEVV